MYCQSCGEELDASAKFCEHCGAQVESAESTTPPAETSSSTHHESTTPPAEASRDTRETYPPATSRESKGAGGLEPNVAGALSYLFGFITGLIFFLIEEEDEFVRFHAAQSMVVFGGLLVFWIVLNVFTSVLGFATGFFFGLFGLLFGLIWLVISLGSLVLWIFLMIKAYQGETPRIPIAASIADDLV